VVLIRAIDDLRDSGRDATRSRRQNAAADGLEKLVIDLETGADALIADALPP
jgi:hypothetical protein